MTGVFKTPKPAKAPPPTAPPAPPDTDEAVRRQAQRRNERQGREFFLIDLIAGENAAGLQSEERG